jgi:hypothetical protein
MSDSDREIARRSLDMQSRAHDVPLLQIPAYAPWSKKKLDDGVSEALIAHLDSMSMWLLPEDISAVGAEEFEDLLSELQDSVENG